MHHHHHLHIIINNTHFVGIKTSTMSDDEAASAVAALPHEIAERSPLGIFLDAVVDVHVETAAAKSHDDDENAGGGKSFSAENQNTKGVVSTSVHPREETRHPDALQSVEYSPDGALFASIASDKNAVHVLDASTTEEVHKIDGLSGATCASFSHTGRYLSVYRKGGNFAGGTKEKNVSVWEVGKEKEARKVFECFQKTFVKQEWPYVQFTKDDAAGARCVTNEIQFYDCEKFDENNVVRYRIPGVALARLSASETKPTIGVFVPESKGIPGSVRIYEVPDVKNRTDANEVVNEPRAVARKSFFRISEVELKWSPNGSALLVCGYCEVDSSNKNYYGESSLHFLKADGSLDCKVDLSKEGPVHDAQWSPTSENFAVCYGFMPAKCTIFDAKKCTATYELGAGPHNTIRWNPFGRFIMLAGFGNLPGDVKFYHRLFDGKFKLMGSCRSACSVTAEWSPCGRRLLTSTVAPRLNVDNGFKIWRYNGELLAHVEREKLYEAVWRPRKEGSYPSLGISKNSKRVEGGSANGSANAIPEKPAAFVPPHLRNKNNGGGSSSGTSAMGSRSNSGGNFSLATVSAEEARAGKVKAAVENTIAKKQQTTQKRFIPGAEPMVVETAAQKKNRKKAEARRAKKLAEEMEKKV